MFRFKKRFKYLIVYNLITMGLTIRNLRNLIKSNENQIKELRMQINTAKKMIKQKSKK